MARLSQSGASVQGFLDASHCVCQAPVAQVSVRTKWAKRLDVSVTSAVVAVGFVAASARSKGPLSRGVLNAELQLLTAGPGTLTVAPAEGAESAACKTDAQLPITGDCNEHY